MNRAHIEEYNEIIRNVVEDNACHLIDLYSYKMPYDSVDGSHPISEGMSTIVKSVIRTMIEEESEIFFTCEKEKQIYPVQHLGVLDSVAIAFWESSMATFVKSQY